MDSFLLISICGLITGSFLNVCIHRLPRGESIIYPPSQCPGCGGRLKPLDLVPVLSYLWLRGKCRHCGECISPRYPLVEVLTALLFTAAFLRFGFGWELLRAWVLVGVLVVAAGTDLDCYRIPDKLTGFGVAAGLLLGLSGSPSSWPGLLQAAMGLVVGGGIVFLVLLVSRGGMGGGDVKLAAAAGTFLGPAGAVLFFFLAATLAAVVGLVLVALGRKGMRSALPFGPFLAVSGLLVLFFGNGIINWYLSLWPML